MDTLTKINVKVTAKAKALSCWIFENVPNEKCGLLTEKKTKSKISPKILLEKNEERENKKSEEKERRRRKKSNGCTPFYVDFFGDRL